MYFSLDNLTTFLRKAGLDKFVEMKRWIETVRVAQGVDEEDKADLLELMTQKGVYPYSYINDFEKMSDTSLHPKEKFYD